MLDLVLGGDIDIMYICRTYFMECIKKDTAELKDEFHWWNFLQVFVLGTVAIVLLARIFMLSE